MSTVDPRSGARAPLFFLSYSLPPIHWVTGNPAENISRFYKDLSVHVSELVGPVTGVDPGFLDSSIAGGERWSPELLQAAGTCQVFVPLVSSTLLGSDWCGREWDAFARRRIVPRSGASSAHETAIVPVTWSPTNGTPLPRVLRDIQRFSPTAMPDPDIAVHYQRDGVYGLLTMQWENAYRAVVWRLAQRIVAIHRSYLVEPWVPASVDELCNRFTEEPG
ncbi:TIR domain-containing protein [Micromonospora coriariae]|uniref:TIR domain-containing protein n=1 Tax=Micromonospora coriariae TaxID=285665 RepID=A0A1C4USD1_9ACTN|nr:TIR-like protein FxsC [Micromonospora coriariae]SCE74551.1 TIR domain-containing protein [Micromonospora coriariae]